MVLCAKSADGTKVEFMEPPPSAALGTRVEPQFFDGGSEPAKPNSVKKKKIWEGIAENLLTNDDSVATWSGRTLMAAGEPCRAKSITQGTIG